MRHQLDVENETKIDSQDNAHNEHCGYRKLCHVAADRWCEMRKKLCQTDIVFGISFNYH